MGWEALEAGFVAHESMDVNEQQCPPSISIRLGWHQGMCR
jgi:hypothetical protein